MSEHHDEPLLIDMRDACRQVMTYIANADEGAFLNNTLLQDAVSYRLQVVGEAAYKVSMLFKEAHPEIDWFKISGLRHRVVHDYRNIDMPTLWRITQKYVPPLREQLDAILGRGIS